MAWLMVDFCATLKGSRIVFYIGLLDMNEDTYWRLIYFFWVRQWRVVNGYCHECLIFIWIKPFLFFIGGLLMIEFIFFDLEIIELFMLAFELSHESDSACLTIIEIDLWVVSMMMGEHEFSSGRERRSSFTHFIYPPFIFFIFGCLMIVYWINHKVELSIKRFLSRCYWRWFWFQPY